MKAVVPSLLVLLAAAGSANAFEFRVRFVERVGSVDLVLPGKSG